MEAPPKSMQTHSVGGARPCLPNEALPHAAAIRRRPRDSQGAEVPRCAVARSLR